MRIAPGRMVPLGYGSYARSDRIKAIEPIEEGRGPGRRTWVWVDDVPEALVASRSDGAILRDMTTATETAGAAPLRQLLGDILETVDRLEPTIRSIIRDQAGWNLDRLEERIRDALGEE